MWTRSAASKETGKFTVICTDYHNDIFFTGEFDSAAEADAAGEAAERRMDMWEASGRYQPDLNEVLDDVEDFFSDAELLAALEAE